jgi:hypothetical protein
VKIRTVYSYDLEYIEKEEAIPYYVSISIYLIPLLFLKIETIMEIRLSPR